MVQTGFGGPEVVHLQHVDEPSPRAREVLLRVEACGLNRLDVLQRRGPGILPGFHLPHIAGMDVTGTVLALGSDVAPALVSVGQRVVADPAQGCGLCESCSAGEPGYCPELRVLGGNVPGGLAELVTVDATSLVAVPGSIAPEFAATLPTAWATAWHALHPVGRVAAGECVLVQAAASAVSLAVIALAKRSGASVVAVASTDLKLAAAANAGADLIVRNDAAVTDIVAGFTGGRGADLVIDHVGAETFATSMASLRVRGRLVMLGNTTGDRVDFSLADAFHRGLQLLGAGGYTSEDFRSAMAVCLAEELYLPTAGAYGLDELSSAWQLMESRDTVGKVVVLP